MSPWASYKINVISREFIVTLRIIVFIYNINITDQSYYTIYSVAIIHTRVAQQLKN